MTRQERLQALAASVLIAAALLLLFSRCSPLYPTNSWGEANAFFTVGRGMLAGKVPYKDLVLGAGPVVFALHALAALISSTGFLGVWLLEIAALAGLVYFSWKSAVRISGMPGLSMGMAALLALVLVSCKAFVQGDTVEEFALPLQAWALCDLLSCLGDEDKRISPRRLALHGFMAGCVFWMKYELLGVHLAFIAILAVDDMARSRRLRGAICMCAMYAAGAVLAALPWLLYFGANGALDYWLYHYILPDLRELVSSIRPVLDPALGLVSGMKNNPAAALLMLGGAAYLLRRLVHRKWSVGCTAAVAAFACAVLFAYAGGLRYRFSPMALGAFLMLCAGPLALLADYAWRRRRAYAALLACGALLCAAHPCLTNDNLPFIGYPGEELPQRKFAAIMEEEGGGALLVRYMPDCGFYLAAGQVPQFQYFAHSVAYDSRGSEADSYYATRSVQDGLIRQNRPEWIVSHSAASPDGMYVLAAQASSPFDSREAGKKEQYYLYRRLEE